MNFYDISALLQGFWPVVVGFVIVIFWFARLEYKSNNNEERIVKLEDKDGEIAELKNTIIAIDSKLSVLIEGYNGK